MSPLRIGPNISWETAFTFEAAMNYVTSCAEENELFFFEAGENPSELWELYQVAQRCIQTIWTGKRTTNADTRALEKLISSCKVGQSREGKPYVYTPDIEALEEQGLARVDELDDGLRRALADGICELLLRGEERDIRACLWDGRLFRADRSNAVFCKPSCRTGFHRARNTAVRSSRSEGDLMGKFRCVDCEKYQLITEASGIRRQEDAKAVSIGLVDSRAVCVSCVEKNHSEWIEYVVPMGPIE